MATNQRNARIILMGEDEDAETIIQLYFARSADAHGSPINVGRTERTISVEPLVDAPIVPIKSAEVKPQSATHAQAETNTQEVNFVPLLFAGLMIGCISFSVGQMVGYYQGSVSKLEAIN
ncbi:hypothetical protein IQ264_28620 [Phormidium sp. LEGE 05292]|uniref:hypothetical protein n=1 Tax=[Phormidium] sp. LEGE 05292 TaxID=767427 RepID=UPI001880C2A7|nr:hypothetical protein [Phormidium sp. LEGE 05292]MBE9229373.1 hypothetical protein [Phormidium sp. LEGE 05292]